MRIIMLILKILKTVIAVLLCMGLLGTSIVMCLNTRVITATADKVITDFSGLSGYDCILVLGAGVRPGGEPSPMLRDRLSRGVELYNAGVSGKLVMSGDHGSEYYDEVNAMKKWAINAGAASEDIFMDHAGFSTYESLYRLKEVFCAESVVIVTQRYHLYRALYIAQALGLDAVGVPTEETSYSGQIYRDIREIAARVKDVIYAEIKPKPTYLGDEIPIWGNGDVTND